MTKIKLSVINKAGKVVEKIRRTILASSYVLYKKKIYCISNMRGTNLNGDAIYLDRPMPKEWADKIKLDRWIEIHVPEDYDREGNYIGV